MPKLHWKLVWLTELQKQNTKKPPKTSEAFPLLQRKNEVASQKTQHLR
jgi:hypothetical protein